jgi:two-component system sensor histidine kinase BaeS
MVLPGSHSGFSRLRRSLDRLGVKLFLAIAGANLVLVVAVYLIYSWSFDQGLVDYVNRTEQARLTPMITRLAEGYRRNGSWSWLTEDREGWAALLGESLGWRLPRRGWLRNEGGGNAPGGEPELDRERRYLPFRTPRAEPVEGNGAIPPITIDWRVMLFDASQQVLIPYPGARSDDLQLAVKLPVRVDGSVVGYLGYIPRLRLVRSLESITAAQQWQRFGVISIGMFAAVLLNAALISHWLSRRLRVLGHGATALARGEYAMRIPARGHDEIARLADDFNHLAQALEAARRGRQQWIADIAHELRTPLTSLRAEIEAVQDGVRPLSQSSIASIAQEVQQLTRLVEDLRLLSLSDLGALTYHKEPVPLAEVIGDALAAGRAAIAEQRLEVQTVLDASLIVAADADRLAQVFGNLLHNTLRYSEAPARLRITLAAEAGQARVDWEDSPPGVNDADLSRLTERLYRVDESRARASGGSGLGLAIVKAIVDAHDGRMEASRSALGGTALEHLAAADGQCGLVHGRSGEHPDRRGRGKDRQPAARLSACARLCHPPHRARRRGGRLGAPPSGRPDPAGRDAARPQRSRPVQGFARLFRRRHHHAHGARGRDRPAARPGTGCR